jgi:hypothetical protein
MIIKERRSKDAISLVVLGTAILAFGLMGCVEVPGLYSTGVDNNGDPLPIGSDELHYVYSGPVSPPAEVLAGHVNWVIPPVGSAWIGPANGDISVPVGDYVYTLEFDLTGFDPDIASIKGELAADNVASIWLNGVDTGFVHPDGTSSFRSLEPFSIKAGFVSGMNTLEFLVSNNVGPSGLLIANLRGGAVPLP